MAPLKHPKGDFTQKAAPQYKSISNAAVVRVVKQSNAKLPLLTTAAFFLIPVLCCAIDQAAMVRIKDARVITCKFSTAAIAPAEKGQLVARIVKENDRELTFE